MKLKVFLLIAQGFFMQKIGDKCEENISGYHLKWERIQACSIFKHAAFKHAACSMQHIVVF